VIPMYSTSTQKREWTFGTVEELNEKRVNANAEYRARFAPFVQPEEESGYLTTDEEQAIIRMVSERGVAFGESFRPPLWPSIRWMAYAYFKRFFLVKSAMEYSPKVVMTACYYLAAKIDEFYVPIHEFVENLRSGSAEQNTARILALEPEIMRVLKYHLTIHCPFRPFEGHLMEMKRTLLLLNFDIETLRPAACQFLRDSLLGDAMLQYAPSQIALAAIKHSLDSNAKSPEVLCDFVQKLLGVSDDGASDSWSASGAEAHVAVEKLLARLELIVESVRAGAAAVPSPPEQQQLQTRSMVWSQLQQVLETRKMADPSTGPNREEPVDSDDD
ncbi:hypothetical protein PFISCL1PPCAC_23105, partial [Pristionchus fissidentatus]